MRVAHEPDDTRPYCNSGIEHRLGSIRYQVSKVQGKINVLPRLQHVSEITVSLTRCNGDDCGIKLAVLVREPHEGYWIAIPSTFVGTIRVNNISNL